MRKMTMGFPLLLAALPLTAQVTFQHGNTLSQLINNLYGGNGIQLKPNGHQAHFGETEDFQQFTAVLQAVLQARPVFPIPSSVGVVSYNFNEQTGTYERVQGSFGPILGERATTSGHGHANVSVSYTFSDFEKFNGASDISLTLHHCTTADCTFGNPNQAYLRDVIAVGVHMKLKSQVVATSIVYGVTDRIDAGVVLPYIRNDLNVFAHAVIVPDPATPPGVHQFDPTIQTPDQFGTAHAIGIGDIVLRGKIHLPLKKLPFETAALTDITLPSGDKQNFLGTGDLRVKETLIVSKTAARFSPHLNVGYELNTNHTKLSSVDYRAGSEVVVSPRLTLVGDLLGLVQPSISSQFRVRALEGQSLTARSLIDGSFGGKWQMGPRSLFTFNLLLPMNTSGIRPNSVVTFGVQVGL